MILLAGIPTEPPVELAKDSADAAGIECIVLNQRSFAFDDIEMRFVDGKCAGEIRVGMQSHPLGSFTGIYTRMTDAESLPELAPKRNGAPDPSALNRARAWSETMNAWLELAPQRVANRTSATLSNFSKPYQMQKILSCGLQVPETLVTNSADLVLAFQKRHRRVIYKSISSVRSIVKMLDGNAIKSLERIAVLPTQFQEFVPGDNVRVHVVGSEVLGVRIKSEAVDYRYAGKDGLAVEMEDFDLPPEVSDRCVGLSAALNLPFCGIDFKLTPGGDYVCFEVNPSPAYSYYQENAGIAISDALVRYLANAQKDL